MGILYTNPFTPERILAATEDQELADRAGRALAAIESAGIDPWRQPIDWALLLHVEGPHGVAAPLGTVAEVLMLLAAVSDPDGGAPASFFSRDVSAPKLEQRINLINSRGWVGRNRPDSPRSGCNVSGAMEEILVSIADEHDIPALKQLASLSDKAEPPTIVMRPHAVAIVAYDKPDYYYRFRDLIHLTSLVPIRWIILSSGEEVASFYQSELALRQNAHVVTLSKQGVALPEDQLFVATAEGLGDWYRLQAGEGLVPSEA